MASRWRRIRYKLNKIFMENNIKGPANNQKLHHDAQKISSFGTVRFFVCGPVMACRQAGPDFHQVGLMNRSPYRIAN